MNRLRPPTLYERLLRRFNTAVQIITLLPFYALCVACIGAALAPAIALFNWVNAASLPLSMSLRALALGMGCAGGFLVYGLTLIIVVPLFNVVLVGRLRPWRGPYFSGASVRWYIHNGLVYIVRFTFLEFITPTPLNILFFRMMGMKIGVASQINSSHISDPSLIRLGDRVTIGGSATLIAHYGVGGFLVLAPVQIGDGATIGLRAIVMGGTEIGANARILPNSVVLPKTKVPAGETWGGVPAARIENRANRTSGGESA